MLWPKHHVEEDVHICLCGHPCVFILLFSKSRDMTLMFVPGNWISKRYYVPGLLQFLGSQSQTRLSDWTELIMSLGWNPVQHLKECQDIFNPRDVLTGTFSEVRRKAKVKKLCTEPLEHERVIHKQKIPGGPGWTWRQVIYNSRLYGLNFTLFI